MSASKIHLVCLLFVYSASALLGSSGCYLCISEHGQFQIEFALSGCNKSVPDSSNNNISLAQSSCGNCDDYSLLGSYVISGRGSSNQHQQIAVTAAANAAGGISAQNTGLVINSSNIAEPAFFTPLRTTILVI